MPKKEKKVLNKMSVNGEHVDENGCVVSDLEIIR